MTGIQKTLLAIAAFILLGVGTFIYFITNWDASKAEPIGAATPIHPVSVPENSRGLGQSPSHTLAKHPNADPCTPISSGPKSLSTQSEK